MLYKWIKNLWDHILAFRILYKMFKHFYITKKWFTNMQNIDLPIKKKWSLSFHTASVQMLSINTHSFCQQCGSGGTGEALEWAAAVFWCEWSIWSPCMFRTPSKGNKDPCLPVYLQSFSTVSLAADHNNYCICLCLCVSLFALVVVCDTTYGLGGSSW